MYLSFYSILLAVSITACGVAKALPTTSVLPPSITQEDDEPIEDATSELQLELTTPQGKTILFALNDSSAAKSFYKQLPLSLDVENYGEHEKIFYPPEKLDTSDTPLAKGPTGTLAYYAPWGNVAIYSDDCGGASGLYQLGQVVSGAEYISQLSGVIQLESVRSNASSMPSTSQMKPSVREENTMRSIQIAVGNEVFSATLENNDAANSFVQLLQSAPVVIQMSDYSGFEKVGALGTSLPESNRQITAQSGDIILYNGNQICVFYGSNSWSYTKLGRIDDLSGWVQALGSGDVTLTFSLH